jgi:hypothetical protein
MAARESWLFRRPEQRPLTCISDDAEALDGGRGVSTFGAGHRAHWLQRNGHRVAHLCSRSSEHGVADPEPVSDRRHKPINVLVARTTLRA